MTGFLTGPIAGWPRTSISVTGPLTGRSVAGPVAGLSGAGLITGYIARIAGYLIRRWLAVTGGTVTGGTFAGRQTRLFTGGTATGGLAGRTRIFTGLLTRRRRTCCLLGLHFDALKRVQSLFHT